MSAYLVAYFTRSREGRAALLGIDIFSEENPTVEGDRRTACLYRWPGETYAEARDSLRAHLERTAPWLLPEKNGGRK